MTSHRPQRPWRRTGWLFVFSALVLAVATPFVYGSGATQFDYCVYRSPDIALGNIVAEPSYFPLGIRCLYQPLAPNSTLIIAEPGWGLTLTVYGALILLCLGIASLLADRYPHSCGGEASGRHPAPFRRAGDERRSA